MSDEEILQLIDRNLAALRKRCREEKALPIAMIGMQQVGDSDDAQPIFFSIASYPQSKLPALLAEIAKEVRLCSVLRN